MPVLDLEAFLYEQADMTHAKIEKTAEDVWMLSLLSPRGEPEPFCRIRWKETDQPGYALLAFDTVLRLVVAPTDRAVMAERFVLYEQIRFSILSQDDTLLTVAYECARILCPYVLIDMIKAGDPHAAKQFFADYNEGIKGVSQHLLGIAKSLGCFLPRH
ncbi:MAG: hypothetical protein JWO84_192 [Parcubacteria group bacterium]|nr:hypothetical protein [Parcubacteria group bacterium]